MVKSKSQKTFDERKAFLHTFKSMIRNFSVHAVEDISRLDTSFAENSKEVQFLDLAESFKA